MGTHAWGGMSWPISSWIRLCCLSCIRIQEPRRAPGRRGICLLGAQPSRYGPSCARWCGSSPVGEPLAPVATIVTERTVRHLVDAGRELLAEPGDADACVDRAH